MLIVVNFAKRQAVSDGEEDWYNRAEEINKSDVGTDEFKKRLDKQNKMFEVISCNINFLVSIIWGKHCLTDQCHVVTTAGHCRTIAYQIYL